MSRIWNSPKTIWKACIVCLSQSFQSVLSATFFPSSKLRLFLGLSWPPYKYKMESNPRPLCHRSTELTTIWCRAVVVAQLVERLLPIPEVRGSNPVISKIYIEHFTVNCIEKTKIKKKRPELVHLKNPTIWCQPDLPTRHQSVSQS